MNSELFDYIKKSPTAFHAVSHTAEILENEGFSYLAENEKWNITLGGKYYTTRNSSSLIAFTLPKTKDFSGFMMSAAHCDSPYFKIKENAIIADDNYVKLSCEKYGGAIFSTWMDRPLSIAGRVMVKTDFGLKTMLVDLHKPLAIIPNVAIHMNRNVNDSQSLDAAVDMSAIIGLNEKITLNQLIADELKINIEDILSTDLCLYNPQKAVEYGEMISAPRLDDLQCAFSSLKAFLKGKSDVSSNVYCLFDNEEVGSHTKQGAASTLLYDTLTRICDLLGLSSEEYKIKIANSFLVSCDNAHAVHPNHPEYKDANHSVYMNKGIVIKYNANQNYTTDAVSASIFKLICQKADVPYQLYANRANMAGGSTLGNIANTQVSLNTIDIGNAQLAMHSSYETAGSKDTEYMIKALEMYFNSSIKTNKDGVYTLL